MSKTISQLPPGGVPLTGSEVLPADQTSGGTSENFTAGDVAKLGELYAMANLGARPERLDAAGTHFTMQGTGNPLTVWFAPAIATAVGYGPVYQAAGQANLWSRGVVPCSPDKVYEVEAEIVQVSVGGGESPVCRVGVRSLDGNYADTDVTPNSISPASAVLTGGQVLTVRHRFGGANFTEVDQWADTGSAIYLRPYVEANLKADLTGFVATSVVQVRRLLIRDVTSLVDTADFLFALGQS